MRMKALISTGILASGLFFMTILSSAQESSERLAQQALEECNRGRLAVGRATRLAHFQQGQSLGERAVETDEESADAHFALFCNLGELLRIDGESLTSLFGLRRMMNELDRTLELNPDYMEALSAKGTLLVKLPVILGGGVEKGQELLEHVINRAPKAINARLALAKVRCEHGRHHEAVTLASDALTIAQEHNQADFILEARAVLEQLQVNATKASHKAQF